MKVGSLISVGDAGPALVVKADMIAGVYAGGPIAGAWDMTRGLYHGDLYRIVVVLIDSGRESWMVNFDKSNVTVISEAG